MSQVFMTKTIHRWEKKMFTKEFWMKATERAVKTVAQSFIALAAAADIFNVFSADWQTILGVSLGAGLLSYATSLVTPRVVKGDEDK